MLKVKLIPNVKFRVPPLTRAQREALIRYREKRQKELDQRFNAGRTCRCGNNDAD